MAQFNRSGAEFFPAGDPGIDYATARSPEEVADFQDGLYYRSVAFPELEGQVKDCIDGVRSFGKLSIDGYQSWNETGWKEPHASFRAAQRFREKALEEQSEVDNALEEFWDSGDNRHLIEELGDFGYIATAFANNGGAVVGDAIKQRLYEYSVGTKVYAEGKFNYPEWYNSAAALSIKRDPITIDDIDDLVAAGFVPRFSPVMNLYEAEEICATNFIFDFRMYAIFMASINDRRFAYGEEQRSIVSAHPEAKEDLGKIIAEVYFRIAAISYLADSTLSEVIQKNIEKITYRIKTGTVDKSDGPRIL